MEIIACICEGTAERAVIEILLENNLLSFRKEDLLEERVFSRTNARKFCLEHLNRNFNGNEIRIVRILDKKDEGFPIPKVYEKKISQNEVFCTRPEIEMLIIHSLGKYSDYIKHKTVIKPSEYCKGSLKISNVKSYDFWKEHFKNVNDLIVALRQYKSKHKFEQGENCILDLLIFDED